jgi:acetyl esterase/lipase
MASEQFQAVVGALRANKPDLQNEDVHVLRASMESWAPDGLPEGVDIETVEANGVPAEFVRAPAARTDAALLYLHGGGYCIGSIRTHRGLAAQLSRTTSLPVLLIDYRLAPEHPHPAAVDDATSAYGFLLDRGIAPGKIAIAGDSAGGGLTIATLLAIRDRDLPRPAAGVAISPWTDMGCDSGSYTTRAEHDPMVTQVGLKQMADWFLAGQDPRDPLASPLHADLSGLPPLLVHVGDHEVLLDDGVGVAERARAAGVDVTVEVWPEMIHVWHAFVGVVPESQQAIDAVAAFLAANVAG